MSITTDPISDLLSRIRNGQMAKKNSVKSPFSKVRQEILRVLSDEGYIRGFSVNENTEGKRELTVELKYYEDQPVIKMIQRVSKPGRRVYSPIDELPLVSNGLGINILSTSKGVMPDYQAREIGVGGEIICKVF